MAAEAVAVDDRDEGRDTDQSNLDRGDAERAMHPPSAVRMQHARLTAAVAQLAKQLAPILKRVRQGYLVAAAQIPNLSAGARVGEALTALKKHGYRVG